jgi:hypothetical protein
MTNLPREYTQLISAACMMSGIVTMVASPENFNIGVVLTCIACWVMLISESVLLARVQTEMSLALEALRKKQEVEVQDLLFYLRQSQLGNSPWSNLDAAKNYINKIEFPAIITDSGGACIALNKQLTEALGYDKDFIGQLCHGVTPADIYGEYVQGIQANLTAGKRYMHSRLTMIDIDQVEHHGTVALIFMPDMRTATGIWLPDDAAILKSIES